MTPNLKQLFSALAWLSQRSPNICYAQSTDSDNPRILRHKPPIRDLRNNPRITHANLISEDLVRKHYLDDSQLETTLLRSCLALPKISYVLRACPPTHLTQAAEELDFAMRETLETITGVPMSDWSWLKASLPCSRGGLNICSTVLHAPAALIASSHSAQSLVESILGFSPGTSHHINAAVTALAATAARLNWTCLEEVDVPLHQKPLSYAIDDASYQHLLSTAPTTRSRALTLSCGLPHAGDCLNVVPSPPMGLHLQDKEFRSCLRYWLGVSLHSSSYPCPECEGIADVFGDHRVGCGGNGDRIPRHNTVQDALFCAAQSAALVPTKEVLSLLPWFPPKRPLAWCPAPAPDLQTSFSPLGGMVAQQLWTFTSSHHSNSRLWLRQPSTLGTP